MLLKFAVLQLPGMFAIQECILYLMWTFPEPTYIHIMDGLNYYLSNVFSISCILPCSCFKVEQVWKSFSLEPATVSSNGRNQTDGFLSAGSL